MDYGTLEQAIRDSLREEKLVEKPEFITKVIQVHETQLVRHSMMLVGDAGGGKTTNQFVLMAALKKLHALGEKDELDFLRPVDIVRMNPKAITYGELYGCFNELTREWYVARYRYITGHRAPLCMTGLHC